jgi:hypothetical protein
MPDLHDLHDMPDLHGRLLAARSALDDLVRTANACADVWAVPAAPGKWSPTQVVEHVARSFEEAAVDLAGQRSGLLNLPAPLRFVARKLLFERVLARGRFPRAKTNRAMDPAAGSASPAEAAARLDGAWRRFADACAAAPGARARSRVFGNVPIVAYVRFHELHARHHTAQMVRT